MKSSMRRREFLLSAAFAAARRKSRHVVLFTSDGVRRQDLFGGMDATLVNDKMADLRQRLWRPTAQERRATLMPFFWNTLVPRGVLLGNMQVTNRYRVSYPGYSEILTGRTQDEVIRGNDPVQNPTPSLFEFLKERSHLRKEQVAVFASWVRFHSIAEARRGSIYINAGYEASPLPRDSAKVGLLNRLQMDARYLDDSSRHDAFTFELAMEYLAALQPEHLFISFDETDDWAHNKRYDQVLKSLEYFDRALKTLWGYLQNSPKYRDSTTLVITTDHGRGATLDDYSGHGAKVAGAEQIWAAFIGPDTPAKGELRDHPLRRQCDIAPTILNLLGIENGAYPGMSGAIIPEAIGQVAMPASF